MIHQESRAATVRFVSILTHSQSGASTGLDRVTCLLVSVFPAEWHTSFRPGLKPVEEASGANGRRSAAKMDCSFYFQRATANAGGGAANRRASNSVPKR